jgi:ABC-2 type transport system ATP-binding protein
MAVRQDVPVAPASPLIGASSAGEAPAPRPLFRGGSGLAVETEGLRKEFGRRVAVANLTLRVPEGQVFGFLGPNGAGKSTTVKMLVGLVHPTSGTGKLFGRPLGDATARRWLGFLPEQFRFHEWLRAEEFLEFHASLYGVPRGERARRIAEVLHLIGLEARAHDTLRTFSKGMLQRIGIGQALIADPKLVILDEPTSALDPIGRREVRDVIRTLRGRGVAIFLNSHLLSEVEMVCDQVAIIDRGQVVRQGPLKELIGKSLEIEVRVADAPHSLSGILAQRWPLLTRHSESIETFSAPTPEGVETLRFSVDDEAEAGQIADAVVRGGGTLLALIPHHKTLEDLFVQSVETRDV